jgi:hypothetical protein
MRLFRNGLVGLACRQLQQPGNPPGLEQQLQQQQQEEQQEQKQQQQLLQESSDQQQQQQQQHVAQFCTFEVPSDILHTFQCDVIMPPGVAEVAAAMHLGLATATAAAAAATHAASCPASTTSSSKHLLVVPLLPAQHVSLMAAAARPELVQQQQQQQEEEGAVVAAKGSTSEPASADSDTDDNDAAAAAGLTFWQLHVGLTPAGMRANAVHSAAEEDQRRWCGTIPTNWNRISACWRWLVPHWLPHQMPKDWWPQLQPQQQHDSGSGSSGSSSAGFDAAELYSAVKPRGDEPMLQQQPAELLPLLRPYQRRAAAWMLAREGVQQQQQQQQQRGLAGQQTTSLVGEGRLQTDLAALVQQQLHPLWRCALLLRPPAAASAYAGAAISTSSSSPVSCPFRQLDSKADVTETDDNSSAGVLYFCPYTCKVSLQAFEAPVVSGGAAASAKSSLLELGNSMSGRLYASRVALSNVCALEGQLLVCNAFVALLSLTKHLSQSVCCCYMSLSTRMPLCF